MSLVIWPQCGACGSELPPSEEHSPEDCERQQEINRRAVDEWRRRNAEWKQKLASGEAKPVDFKLPPTRVVKPAMIESGPVEIAPMKIPEFN